MANIFADNIFKCVILLLLMQIHCKLFPMVQLTVSMMSSSNGNIFRVTGLLCREFTSHRWIPLTKASGAELVFFDLRLNKRLSKQSWGCWFEMSSCPLWRHCNSMPAIIWSGDGLIYQHVYMHYSVSMSEHQFPSLPVHCQGFDSI